MFRTVVLTLSLVLSVGSLAEATDVEGTWNGQTVKGTIARQDGALRATLDGGWSGVGKRVSAHTWVFDLERKVSVGARGRLALETSGEGHPLKLLVTRGRRGLRAILIQNGNTVGSLSVPRRPANEQDEKPKSEETPVVDGRLGEPAKKPDPNQPTAEDRRLAALEYERMVEVFKEALQEQWFFKEGETSYGSNLSAYLPSVYGWCARFASDLFDVLFQFDPRYHRLEHIRGFSWYGAPHQVVRVTDLTTGKQTVFDGWAVAGGWTSSGWDWSKGIFPYEAFGYDLSVSSFVNYTPAVSAWRLYREGGPWHEREYGKVGPLHRPSTPSK